MEKRFSVEDGTIIVSVIVPLSQSEEKKMEQKKLQDRIDNAAKDFNLQWAIEKNNSISMAIISRMIGSEVTEDDCHQLEIDATKFMDFIDDIKVPEKKKEKTVEQIDMNEINFVKDILADIIEDKVSCAFLMSGIEERFGGFGCIISSPGRIGQITLRKMCECYLEKYDHE